MQNAEQLAWTGVAKSIDTPFPSAPAGDRPGFGRLEPAVRVRRRAGADRGHLRAHQPHPARQGDARDLSGPRHGGADGRRHRRIYTATFALGSGLAAAAGALLGPVFVVYPTMGDLASLKAFAIVILGGLGSIAGATIGGFILAFMEELGAGYISSGYRDAMGFLLIILILIFKPTGLFARRSGSGEARIATAALGSSSCSRCRCGSATCTSCTC